MANVSFVLPAYKRLFLKEAIDSILAQTSRNFTANSKVMDKRGLKS